MTRLVVSNGIILSRRASGEADARITILTESLGLVAASARSSRREISKLRYGLEPFTTARFSFVRGKYEWKLIGVEQIARPLAAASARHRAVAGRIARLLSRLVQGEEQAPLLYRAVADGFALLASAGTSAETESIECVLVLRILFNLGYLPQTAELAPFVRDADLSLELAAEAAASRSALIRAINDSLYATGL